MMKRARLVCVVMGLAGAVQVTIAHGSDLGPFLEGFEKCEVGETFQDYAQRLAQRSINPCCEAGESAVDMSVSIDPPQMLAGAGGEPLYTNRGEYTEVLLPLEGAYHGLPVRLVSFSFGNENGIYAARVLFGTARAVVAAQFGQSVRDAHAAGQAAWEREGYGYSAAIPDEEPGSITCDWSM